MDTQDRAKPATKEEPIATLDDVAKPLDSFGKIIFLVILVEIVLMFGLILFQNSRIKSLNADLTARTNEINSPEFKTLNDQVEEVLAGNEKLKTILSSKLNWNAFYAKLNGVTPKNVRLISITVSDNGAFKADGETSSLSALAEAMVAWKQGTDTATTPFASVTLTSNGFTNDGGARRVTFSVTGQVDSGRIQ